MGKEVEQGAKERGFKSYPEDHVGVGDALARRAQNIGDRDPFNLAHLLHAFAEVDDTDRFHHESNHQNADGL
jgi:hypothetical protein